MIFLFFNFNFISYKKKKEKEIGKSKTSLFDNDLDSPIVAICNIYISFKPKSLEYNLKL